LGGALAIRIAEPLCPVTESWKPTTGAGGDAPGPIRADLAQGRQNRQRRLVQAVVALALGLGLSAVVLTVWIWRIAFAELPAIPGKEALWSLNRPPGITFLDKSGQVMGLRGFRHGPPAPLNRLPPYLPKAFLAAEDQRFYQHHGIDLRSILRAAKADLTAHRVVQGASTLTQQVARGIFLTPDQTLTRKLQEAALAFRIEGLMSKDEILDLYLNRIYFGSGAYGVEAASRTLFNKSSSDLSLSEAAFLAALPKAPSRRDASNTLHSAMLRSHWVLHRMTKAGWISPAQLEDALAHPPVLAPEPQDEADYGYIFDTAQGEVRRLAHGAAPDLVVRLTIDPRLQTEAVRAVRSGVAASGARGVTEGALVALGPEGEILAMVGGLDHRDSAFNRANQARRQPGSAFKPLVYATAFEAGVTPEEVVKDAPVNIKGYAPANADRGFLGPITVTEAIVRSVNTVAVRVADQVGPDKIARLARRFGVTGLPDHPALPIALGAYEVSLLDLAGAYQVFQTGGRQTHPFLVDQISNARGDLIWRRNPVLPTPIYDDHRAGQMVSILREVIESPVGTGRRARLDRPAAGKTGTSQNYRDAWFVGFTPDLVCGVWVGDDHDHPMRAVTGGETPALIWRDFMLAAHKGLAPREFPYSPGADPRAPFYRALSRQFEAAMRPDPAAPDVKPADLSPPPGSAP